MLERLGAWQDRTIDALTARLRRTAAGRFALDVALGMRRVHSARVANAMAFDLFLAAIPTLAASGWIFGVLLKTSRTSLSVAASALDLAPDAVHAMVLRNFDRFDAGVAPVAVGGALWLASGAFHTLMNAFETSRPSERRPWWMKRAIAVGCVVAALVAVALSGMLTVVVLGGAKDAVATLTGHADEGVRLARTIATAIASAVGVTGLALFYRVGIFRPGVRRRVWPGALAAVAIGGTASWVFGEYARSVSRYTVFYGSLAAVAIGLLWLWLWCAALLLGAEVNAQIEERADPAGVARESIELGAARRAMLDSASPDEVPMPPRSHVAPSGD